MPSYLTARTRRDLRVASCEDVPIACRLCRCKRKMIQSPLSNVLLCREANSYIRQPNSNLPYSIIEGYSHAKRLRNASGRTMILVIHRVHPFSVLSSPPSLLARPSLELQPPHQQARPRRCPVSADSGPSIRRSTPGLADLARCDHLPRPRRR